MEKVWREPVQKVGKFNGHGLVHPIYQIQKQKRHRVIGPLTRLFGKTHNRHNLLFGIFSGAAIRGALRSKISEQKENLTFTFLGL